MTESREELRPAGQLSPHGNGGDEGTSSGSDERGGVSNGLESLLFNETLDFRRETGIVDFGIVLENEAGNCSRRFVFCLHLHTHRDSVCVLGRSETPYLSEDIDKVVVEVWVLIQSLQFLTTNDTHSRRQTDTGSAR